VRELAITARTADAMSSSEISSVERWRSSMVGRGSVPARAAVASRRASGAVIKPVPPPPPITSHANLVGHALVDHARSDVRVRVGRVSG